MKNLKSLFIASVLFMTGIAFTGCDNDEEEGNDSVSQTIVIGNQTYKNVIAYYFKESGMDIVRFDIDTDFDGDDNVHGYGYFSQSIIGITNDLPTDGFEVSFNYMNGGYFGPEYKSGTLKITTMNGDEYVIALDAVTKDGTKFKMDIKMIDEQKAFNEYK